MNKEYKPPLPFLYLFLAALVFTGLVSVIDFSTMEYTAILFIYLSLAGILYAIAVGIWRSTNKYKQKQIEARNKQNVQDKSGQADKKEPLDGTAIAIRVVLGLLFLLIIIMAVINWK